ncbi:MAG: glycosyl hydrolase family 18 protein [Candidatus Angelobacter sp.]
MLKALLCILPLTCLHGRTNLPVRPNKTGFRIVGYFNEGGAKSGTYRVKEMETSGATKLLTHLNYAFGRVANNHCEIPNPDVALAQSYDSASSVDGTADPEGDHQLRGTFRQLQELKHLHSKLKVLISLGGWGQSGGFSSAVQPENLHDFVKSCIDVFIKGQFAEGVSAPGIFDGIDIDWEYPVTGGVEPGQPADKANFTAMAVEFRKQLNAVRPGLLLTAALPAEDEYYINFELKKLTRYMDFLSIMAYDLHWNSEPITAFHSALFHDPKDITDPKLRNRYGDYAVKGFIRAQVPLSKIVFGVPFYGKGWSGVADVNHGLYQSAQGQATSAGSYRDIKQLPETADRQYYPAAASCTAWNDQTFWSYDCPQALHTKMKYVRSHHLGGVMFWELSHDTVDSELLHILAEQKRK